MRNFIIDFIKFLHVYDFLKKWHLKIKGKLMISIEINCKKIWLGDHDNLSYGGFYICPSMLNKASIIYSCGIGLDISFEKDIIEKFDCMVYGFDPTPRSVEFIAKNPIDKLKFYPYGINDKNGFVGMHLPKNPEEFVSGSIMQMNHLEKNTIEVPMKKISTIMRELNHTEIDILKMDIEGAEYVVIEDLINSKIKIRQIVLEFHHWLLPNGERKTRKSLLNLRKLGYKVFGISSSGLEISLIKCKRKWPLFWRWEIDLI
ncbi:MAG: FkbM family methyltransferase [Saprospiraceae bacterium]